MGSQMQDKHFDSYWVNHHPECSRTLFHIIKYHPLLYHFFERLAYKRSGGESNSAGTVPAFLADRNKELNLADTRNSNVEQNMTPYSSVGKDLVRRQIKALVFKEIPKKRSRHHRGSTCSQATINLNKNLLITSLQDPVSHLVYNFHKQQVYDSRMLLSRSVSFPLSDSSKRQGSEAIGNGSQPKGQGKLCFGNKTQKPAQFESQKINYIRAMSSVAKWSTENFNICEVMMVSDVNSSSGSAQVQSQKEIKQFKNLKQKIEHVTGERRNEKLRVTMDAVIHKLPQGHEISPDLKKEIFKKLTNPNFTREGECYSESYKESDQSTPSATKHHLHSIRRIWSLQEPLESYCQLHESSFNAEVRSIQAKEIKSRTERACSQLRMLIPLVRFHSLPDLQSLSLAYQNGEFSHISSLTMPIMASGDGTMSSENIAFPEKTLDLNVHSKSNLQLDTPVENLIQENLASMAEKDLVINNILESRLDYSTEINDKVGITINDFGHSCLNSGGSFIDQDIEQMKEYKAAITASASADSKSKSRPVERLDNVAEKKEANMDSLKVTRTTENAQNVEIQSKQLNYDIPHFQMDTRDKAEFNYVKYALEISGLLGEEYLSEWHSSDHPLDPLLFEEMEGDPDFCSHGGSGQCNHHVLFDLINETLLELYGRSYFNCHIMPKGCHTLHQVWTHMSKSLCLRSKVGLTIDDHVSKDLEKRDGWVNLQLDAESVSMELDHLIFHDLLEEIICDLAFILRQVMNQRGLP